MEPMCLGVSNIDSQAEGGGPSGVLPLWFRLNMGSARLDSTFERQVGR